MAQDPPEGKSKSTNTPLGDCNCYGVCKQAYRPASLCERLDSDLPEDVLSENTSSGSQAEILLSCHALGLRAGNESMTMGPTMVQVELLHRRHPHLPSQNAKDLLTQQTSALFAYAHVHLTS